MSQSKKHKHKSYKSMYYKLLDEALKQNNKGGGVKMSKGKSKFKFTLENFPQRKDFHMLHLE